MSRPIRILVIFEGTKISGPAKNLLQYGQIARTAEQPVELEIAVFWRPNDSPVFAEEAQRLGFALHKIPEQGRFDRSVIPALRQLTRQLQPDIVQSHAVKGHFLTRYAGLHRMAPWVAFQHGYTATDLKNRLYNYLDRWSLPAADKVVTMNHPFRQALIRTGVAAERITIVHNAIDPEWGHRIGQAGERAALRQQWNIPPDRQVVLIVGRLSREKDHITLLRAVHGLLGEPGINPHLLIVGDGPERVRIEAEQDALPELKGRVTITGWLPSEPFYGIADVAVLSSLTEGSPNALLEALSAGVPVVATAVGGIPEILRDRDNGLLVAPQDPAPMREAVLTLLQDRKFADHLVSQGLETIRTKHVPEARAAALGEIYRTVLWKS